MRMMSEYDFVLAVKVILFLMAAVLLVFLIYPLVLKHRVFSAVAIVCFVMVVQLVAALNGLVIRSALPVLDVAQSVLRSPGSAVVFFARGTDVSDTWCSTACIRRDRNPCRRYDDAVDYAKSEWGPRGKVDWCRWRRLHNHSRLG